MKCKGLELRHLVVGDIQMRLLEQMTPLVENTFGSGAEQSIGGVRRILTFRPLKMDMSLSHRCILTSRTISSLRRSGRGTSPLDDTRFIGHRRKQIEEIRAKGIDDLETLQYFDVVPRHIFIPEVLWPRAYEDAPLPIGFGQTASQPSLQAYYLQLLSPNSDEKVLEIGTGSGYLTALLALASDRVYSIERLSELSKRARKVLDSLSANNVALLVGDGTIGWKKFAPFNVIVVSAASPSIPPALVDQLDEGGRMLIPVGSRESQELVQIKKTGFVVTEEVVKGAVTFVPLLGRFAWQGEGV